MGLQYTPRQGTVHPWAPTRLGSGPGPIPTGPLFGVTGESIHVHPRLALRPAVALVWGSGEVFWRRNRLKAGLNRGGSTVSKVQKLR